MYCIYQDVHSVLYDHVNDHAFFIPQREHITVLGMAFLNCRTYAGVQCCLWGHFQVRSEETLSWVSKEASV